MNKLAYIFAAAAIAFVGCTNNRTDNSEEAAKTAPDTETASKTETNKEAEYLTDGFKSAAGLPVIVDFSAAWCGPCQQLKPIFEQTAEEWKGKAEFISIDVDEMSQLAGAYNISSIPTLIFFDANGKEINRSVGFIDREQLTSLIREATAQ